MSELDELRRLVHESWRRASHGSSESRAPRADALPLLEGARARLERYTVEHADEPEGWHLLAEMSEILLDYEAARRCLERAMALSGERSREATKKLVLLRESGSKSDELMLTPGQLRDLGKFLVTELRRDGCAHTLDHSECWLREARFENRRKVLAALRRSGGRCDCEVLANVVQ